MKGCCKGILIIVLLLIGCSNYSDKTIKLNNILLKYDLSISHNHHMYIIRSKFYCDGCIQSIYLQLEKKLKEKKSYPVTIISNDKKYLSSDLLSKVVFIADTLKLLNREFPIYSNLTIFETNNGNVIKYKNMGDSKKIALPEFVNEFFESN